VRHATIERLRRHGVDGLEMDALIAVVTRP